MRSVDDDPRFAILTRESGFLEFEVAETAAAVREHYVNLRRGLEVVTSRQIRRLVSDWFVFQQSVATMRPAGGAALGGGAGTFAVDTAVLFPIGRRGIRGELPWNRTSFAEAMASPAPHHEPPTEQLIPTVDRHDALLDAQLAGDAAAVVALLGDDCGLAVRSYAGPGGHLRTAAGRRDVEAALTEELGWWRPESYSVLNRIVTDWYVFADVRWVGAPPGEPGAAGRREIRTALLTPLERDGRFRAVIGYGTDPVPPAP